jgi:hypothetical protein
MDRGHRVSFLALFCFGVLLGCGEPSSQPQEWRQIEERVSIELIESRAESLPCDEERECFRVSVRLLWKDGATGLPLRFHPLDFELDPETELEEAKVTSNRWGETELRWDLKLDAFSVSDLRAVTLKASSEKLGAHALSFQYRLDRSTPVLHWKQIRSSTDTAFPNLIQDIRHLQIENLETEVISRNEGSEGKGTALLEIRTLLLDENSQRPILNSPFEVLIIDRMRNTKQSVTGSTDSRGLLSVRLPLEYRIHENELQQRIDVVFVSKNPSFKATKPYSLILNLAAQHWNPLIGYWEPGSKDFPAEWRDRAFLSASAKAQQLRPHSVHFSVLPPKDSRLNSQLALETQFTSFLSMLLQVESFGFESSEPQLKNLRSSPVEIQFSLLHDDPRRSAILLDQISHRKTSDPLGRLVYELTWSLDRWTLDPQRTWLLLEVSLPDLPAIPPQVFLLAPDQTEVLPVDPQNLMIRRKATHSIDRVRSIRMPGLIPAISDEDLSTWSMKDWSPVLSRLARADLELFNQLTTPGPMQNLEIYRVYKSLVIEDQAPPLRFFDSLWDFSTNRSAGSPQVRIPATGFVVDYSAHGEACLLFRFIQMKKIQELLVCSDESKSFKRSQKFWSFELPDPNNPTSGERVYLRESRTFSPQGSFKEFQEWIADQKDLEFEDSSLELIFKIDTFKLQIR